MDNKISLVIPALSSNFYIEDYIINILFWKKKPSEIIIVNTSEKIVLGQNIKQQVKKIILI